MRTKRYTPCAHRTDESLVNYQAKCTLRQNKLLKKETRFKSCVLAAGKLVSRQTDSAVKQWRKWLWGEGGRRVKGEPQGETLNYPQESPRQKNQDSGLRRGGEGRGETQTPSQPIKGNTGYSPKPREAWAQNGRAAGCWLFSHQWESSNPGDHLNGVIFKYGHVTFTGWITTRITRRTQNSVDLSRPLLLPEDGIIWK